MEKSNAIRDLKVVVKDGKTVVVAVVDITVKGSRAYTVKDHVVKFKLQQGNHNIVQMIQKKVDQIPAVDLRNLHCMQYLAEISSMSTDQQ